MTRRVAWELTVLTVHLFSQKVSDNSSIQYSVVTVRTIIYVLGKVF